MRSVTDSRVDEFASGPWKHAGGIPQKDPGFLAPTAAIADQRSLIQTPRSASGKPGQKMRRLAVSAINGKPRLLSAGGKRPGLFSALFAPICSQTF